MKSHGLKKEQAVITPDGPGSINAIGGLYSYVFFESDEPGTMGYIREYPNEQIKPNVKRCLDCGATINNPSNHALCLCGSYRVSGQARVLWTSKNERWTIERLKSGHIITADNNTAWNDNPVRIMGRVLWDHPERVPKYVKEATGRYI